MTLRKYNDWNRLIGAIVEIRQNGERLRIGKVEDAMPDSSALWIASDGLHPRCIYETAENYEVWVEPQKLTGDNCYRMTNSMLYPENP